jgi:hypothetical protein
MANLDLVRPAVGEVVLDLAYRVQVVRTRTILASAVAAGWSASTEPCHSCSTAITSPSASEVVNINGGMRARPIR